MKTINISCMGAIRPLKNHLTQAIAAIKFAEITGMKLKFHINATRKETNGDPVLKNLRALFDNSSHELVEHGWMDHDEFLDFLESTIDIGLQLSYTETFNIVTADHIYKGIPIITSPEVKIINPFFTVDPNDIDEIVSKLKTVWSWSKVKCQLLNNVKLNGVNRKSKAVWIDWVKKFDWMVNQHHIKYS